MEKIIIAAVADDGAIGKGGSLPWYLPEDLRHFKEVTMGHALVMGRKTFESIGRALPGRMNIVLSRSGFEAEGTVPAASLDEAFRIAEEAGHEKCFIIGGALVYEQALPLADRLDITRVHVTVPDADAFFPDLIWRESSE